MLLALRAKDAGGAEVWADELAGILDTLIASYGDEECYAAIRAVAHEIKWREQFLDRSN